jgi:hypothetical protein
LRAALLRKGIADLAIVKQKADPAAWLEKNLRAALVDNTGVLRVSVAEGGAAERAALANAVADAYLDEIVYSEQKKKVHRLNQLRDLREVQEKMLRERRQSLRKLGEVLGASRPLQQEFDREDLAVFRKELQRVRLAKVAAQARLNYLKSKGGEAAKDAVIKQVEEVEVLAEQEKLLKGEIAPLVEAAKAQARVETAEADLVAVRGDIATTQLTAHKLAEEVVRMEVELQAAPRVRLLQRAEAPRTGK